MKVLLIIVIVSFLGAASLAEHTTRDRRHFLNHTTLRDIGPRIFNGETACKGQIPWQVLLSIDGGYLCGGSLIGDQWVLTAAHCVHGFKKFTVKLGSNLYSGEDPDRATLISTTTIVHENYKPDTLENDIALIKLPQCVTFNYNIQPIALASCELESEEEVVVSGWGGSDTNGNVATNLQYTSLQTLTNKACQSVFGDFVQSYMVCASFANSTVQGACQGDSGGPLVANLNDNPVLVGVVSFVNGIGCGKPYPSGFTRVAVYRGWIRDQSGI